MLEIGKVLSDRYQLKHKLGQNAGRQTWLAKDLEAKSSKDDASLVIVKMLTFGDDIQWDALKLFEREAQILKQLNHDRIPKYRDYFSINERMLWFSLVQEYIPGTSLKELLNQKQRFAEKKIRQIATEILEILIYLHQLTPPVLHRDIKPSNLIMGEDKQVYLVDFGAVQDRAALEGGTFTVVGTYGYAPLEQFGGRAVRASDLYALGTTLIHLLTGIAPADLPTSDLRIQFRDYLSLNLSSEFLTWLEKMTEPALERRFQTAKEARDILKFGWQRKEDSSLTPSSFSRSYRSVIAEIEKPNKTKIEIKKSSRSLEIAIPLLGINGLANLGRAIFLFGSLGLFIWLLATAPDIIPSLTIFWLIVGWRWLKTTTHLFRRTQISFERHFVENHIFKIEKFLFGLKYQQHIGLIDNIKDISINYQQGSFSIDFFAARGIIITLKSVKKNNYVNFNNSRFHKYLLGQGITEAELIWLAQEMRDWIKSV